MLTDVVEPVDPHDPYAKPEPIRTLEQLPKFAPPFDESLDVNLRARGYLHVNCSHCHRFNGGGSSYIYLTHELPLLDMKAVGVRPTQGTFGIENAEILAAGDPYRSTMFFRLAKTGPGHMPHLGAKLIDERAVRMMHDWIRQLPVRADDAAKVDKLIALDEPTVLKREAETGPRAAWLIAKKMALKEKREQPNDAELAEGKRLQAEQAATAVQSREAERKKLTKELLSTPSNAMLLAEATRAARLPPSIHKQVLEAALADKTDPAIRDLFEAFIPADQRTQRLGDAFNPHDVLSLTGDLERGRKLFHESTVVQCRTCHKIDGKGTELGPALDAIGKKYDRAKLLNSILKPSAEIDPKFAMYLVETTAGTVHTGLLVQRDEKVVILKDAKNQQTKFAAADVEGVFAQPKSFMPEMLLRDFTAQQAADLLEYLTSMRNGPDPTPSAAP